MKHSHDTCSDMNSSWERNTHSFIYGSTKGKTGNKVQKTHFLQHCVHQYNLHQLVTPPPPPPQKKRRAKAHRALWNCDRMHEQTDFSTFQLKKLKKGDIHQKRNKGRKKRAFPKRASTSGKGLVASVDGWFCKYSKTKPFKDFYRKDPGAVHSLPCLWFTRLFIHCSCYYM